MLVAAYHLISMCEAQRLEPVRDTLTHCVSAPHSWRNCKCIGLLQLLEKGAIRLTGQLASCFFTWQQGVPSVCACLTGRLGTAGQRSILDIQKEEAERTRAQRESAEKAAAAAGLPAPSPASGGWAKIAGGSANAGGNSMSSPHTCLSAIFLMSTTAHAGLCLRRG